jgi:flagellar biosynthesis anti-sigma factor FlgM
MKIDNNVNIGQANPSSQQKPADTVDKANREQTTGSPGGDSSRVSSLARQIADAKQIADRLPDVRADKIAQAKARLATGFYDSVEAREVLVDKLAALVKNTSAR